MENCRELKAQLETDAEVAELANNPVLDGKRCTKLGMWSEPPVKRGPL